MKGRKPIVKSIEEISDILATIDNKLFDKLSHADYDYLDTDRRISRNGYKRLVYNLNKCGLTFDEWVAWCSD